MLADQAYSVLRLHEDLQDVWREANAVDTAIGRPDALMKKLTRICDAVANAANGYLPALTPAARDVLSERHRQINAEGWTPEHDDAYNRGVLAEAGGIYALHAFDPRRFKEVPEGWPWDDAWWKPSESSRRNLEKAAALILAEIERIDRAIEEAKGGAA
ncbi:MULTISPECIES: hypothetical protein [Comamonas]|uniref:hypothetical protein n=1 Tax=Comamonas TaxID=283 RepID=UPI0001DA6828|nr:MULTISPECIES: hypothetical protein [Comamonas]EFI59742.1 hypothetical protein CTS44_20648 [Comamonas thiooxydans]TFF58305.1 hypothetical protein EIC84_16450 [Comamonas sp. A23]